MAAQADVQIPIGLTPHEWGLLLVQLSSQQDHAQDFIDLGAQHAKLAKAELDLVRRVRGQIENVLGRPKSGELEDAWQERYAMAVEAMGFGEPDEDPPTRR